MGMLNLLRRRKSYSPPSSAKENNHDNLKKESDTKKKRRSRSLGGSLTGSLTKKLTVGVLTLKDELEDNDDNNDTGGSSSSTTRNPRKSIEMVGEELIQQFNGIIDLEKWLALWSTTDDSKMISIMSAGEVEAGGETDATTEVMTLSPTIMAGALLNLRACFPDFHCTYKSISVGEKQQQQAPQEDTTTIIIDGFQCKGTHTGAPYAPPAPTTGEKLLPAIPITGKHCVNEEQQIVLTVNTHTRKIVHCSFKSSARVSTSNTGLMIGFYQQIGGDKYWKYSLQQQQLQRNKTL